MVTVSLYAAMLAAMLPRFGKSRQLLRVAASSAPICRAQRDYHRNKQHSKCAEHHTASERERSPSADVPGGDALDLCDWNTDSCIRPICGDTDQAIALRVIAADATLPPAWIPMLASPTYPADGGTALSA